MQDDQIDQQECRLAPAPPTSNRQSAVSRNLQRIKVGLGVKKPPSRNLFRGLGRTLLHYTNLNCHYSMHSTGHSKRVFLFSADISSLNEKLGHKEEHKDINELILQCYKG